jgi:hypothetical protein
MKNDPKTTSSRRNAGTQAARAIEKLLDRIASQSDDAGPAQQVMADLNRLIEEVRRQYRILADRQVQAALEAALAVEPEDEGQPQAASGERADVLDALEALIQEQQLFEKAAYSLRPPTVTIETPAVIAQPVLAVEAEESAERPPAAAEPADEESDEVLFEGTVRLQVYPGGSMQRVLRFVDDIGKRPQFRILRMSGNPQREGAEIDLGLREPLPLLELLWDMGHAAEPVDSKDGMPVIAVHLFVGKVAQR